MGRRWVRHVYQASGSGHFRTSDRGQTTDIFAGVTAHIAGCQADFGPTPQAVPTDGNGLKSQKKYIQKNGLKQHQEPFFCVFLIHDRRPVRLQTSLRTEPKALRTKPARAGQGPAAAAAGAAGCQRAAPQVVWHQIRQPRQKGRCRRAAGPLRAGYHLPGPAGLRSAHGSPGAREPCRAGPPGREAEKGRRQPSAHGAARQPGKGGAHPGPRGRPEQLPGDRRRGDRNPGDGPRLLQGPQDHPPQVGAERPGQIRQQRHPDSPHPVTDNKKGPLRRIRPGAPADGQVRRSPAPLPAKTDLRPHRG